MLCTHRPLSGSAEHSHHLNGDITLSTHIDDIVNLMTWEQLDDVVLVGHLLRRHGDHWRGRSRAPTVRGLVFLDAVVPTSGNSFVDSYPSQREAFAELAAANRGLFLDPVPSSHFGASPENQALVDELATPFPLATSTETTGLLT